MAAVVGCALAAGAMPAGAVAAGAVPAGVGAVPAGAVSRGVFVKVSAKQVGPRLVRAEVRVVVRAPRADAVRWVVVRYRPAGSVKSGGADQRKRVAVRWSVGKGAYVGVVSFRSKRPGSVRVKVAGVGSAKASARLLTTKLSGWDSSAKVTKGKAVKDTVAVSPAYGRKVLLQRYSGASWVTVRTYTAPNRSKANVAVTITAAEAQAYKKWRVQAVGTGIAKAKSSGVKKLSGKATLNDPGTPDPATPSTPTTPGTGNGYATCNDVFGNPIANCLTISTVAGVWSRDAACGVTKVCVRKPTAEEIDWGLVPAETVQWPNKTWSLLQRFTTQPASGWSTTKTETFYVPGVAEALNDWGVANGFLEEGSNHFRPLKTASGGGPTVTGTYVTADGSTKTIKVPGQGGFAQWWQEQTFGLSHGDYWSRSSGEIHSCGTRTGQDCTPSSANNARMYTNANYPVSGYKWDCSEQVWGGSADETARGYLAGINQTAEPAHWAGLRNASNASNPIYANWGGVRWDEGGTSVVVEMCQLLNTTTGAPSVLPGETA
ncbi:hypothetical protein FB389_1138 [Rarobacter incanus]|uniref:Uncharacterized protein n=1 Tax=Rarobacter incanus TaxID=153494 RepID=A0A542SPH8_9MICO|nr:hypothetical protein FB389_1138 [Rarobacter incanus]